jgi:hypothetical protein
LSRRVVKPVLSKDTLIVSTFEGRRLLCKVVEVFNTVGGIKVKVQSGCLLLVIDPDQVLHVLR